MAFPTTKIEIAFNDGPYVASPTWTDVTTDVRSLSVKRGRTDDYLQFPTGSATVVLSNRTEKYNPLNTAGVYYGKLLPRRQIQVTAYAVGGYQSVFRGYISGWPVSWTQGGLDSTVTIQCFDMLGLLADTQFAADWSYPTIAALNPIYWFRGNDVEGSTTLQNIGSRTSQATGPTSGSLTIIKQPSLAAGLPFECNTVYEGTTYQTAAFNGTGDTAITLMGWLRANQGTTTTSQVILNLLGVTASITIGANGIISYNSVKAGDNYTASSTTGGFNGTVPHHFAMTMTGTTLKLYVDGVDVSGAVTVTFVGTSSQEQVQIKSCQFQELAGFNSALTQAQIQSVYNAGAAQFLETTGARATRIMQTTSIAAALRNVTATPINTVQDINVGGLVVAELQKTADSEGGDLFIDKSGVMQFTNQYYAATQGASTSVATFTDVGGNNPYGQNLDVEYTADTIANDVTVTFSGGGNVRTTSSTSQTSSGVASTTIDTYLSSITGASDLANYELSIRSVLKPQVSAIEASVASTLAQWSKVLDLELLSPFTITRTPPAGTVFTQKMIVNSISHDISPSGWRTSIQGSARYANWFVLDTSALDGPDLLL
jgi:hypothetical protein